VSNLKRKYGTDLTIKFVVNPQLIGGMRVRLGSNVWDGSIQNRLQRLARQI
jgi:F-type H+-transporting ATPase subunit delta